MAHRHPIAAERSWGIAPPDWIHGAEQALSRAASSIRVIATSTPRNLRSELERLEGLWASDCVVEPRFEYADPLPSSELIRALTSLSDRLATEGDLGELYAARARELAEEAAICETVGGGGLWRAARRRFARRDAYDTDADVLAGAWLTETPRPADPCGELIQSDDPRHPRSLLTRMREEVSRRRLPLRIVASREMASLAATGDSAIHIAAGRLLSRRDVERTVLHEVEGHGAPRAVAGSLALGLFAIGTARGSDDQEGRALAIERRHGFLDIHRRRELALRHIAARSVERGAGFVETARLLEAHGESLGERLRITARAHRGGGLARESVYLPALLRVEAAVARDPTIERVLGAGRVAVEAAPVLSAWM
jgi:hypothetical protein